MVVYLLRRLSLSIFPSLILFLQDWLGSTKLPSFFRRSLKHHEWPQPTQVTTQLESRQQSAIGFVANLASSPCVHVTLEDKCLNTFWFSSSRADSLVLIHHAGGGGGGDFDVHFWFVSPYPRRR